MMIKLSIVSVGLASLAGVLASDYYEAATLPQFWKDAADDFSVDWNDLGFNSTEAMWYHQGAKTCIGWGEFDAACNYDERVCCGYNGHTYGYGVLQMAEIKNMIDQGKTEHELCPQCPAAPSGEVYVCHDGYKYAMPSGQLQADFGLPGHMSFTGKGIWMTCDCDEVHRGKNLQASTYWWGRAEAAGLDASKVTYLNNVWYYDDKYSCVGMGGSAALCDNVALVCASGGSTYGYGDQQMYELYEASLLPTGEHAFCPLP